MESKEHQGEITPPVSRIPLQALTMAIPIIIFCIAALAIALTGAVQLGLSDRETASLILALYGIPGVLGLVLTLVYRLPLLMAWNTSSIIFLASLTGEFSYAEMIGATMVAGLLLLLLGLLGLSTRVTAFIPSPIVYGLLAGLIMPYVVAAFTESGRDVALIGITVLVFFVGRRVLPPQVSPLLPTMAAGFVMAAITGQLHAPSASLTLPVPVVTTPDFSFQAILTITPFMFVMTSMQGMLPATIYLRSQGYRPPDRILFTTSGGATTLGSLLGPVPLGMASLLTPFTAGPEAGPHHQRHWSVYASAPVLVLIALAATLAADIPNMIPLTLLLTIAGLGLSGILGQALVAVTRGPIRLGPLFTFVVASSEMNMLGFGPVFWALVIGMGITLLLEGEALNELRASE
jgi:benzoate membrane transport protein